jgi:ParB family chromosome partitioning protein
MINKFRLDSTKSAATKEVISRTIEIANNYAGELSIEVLSLDKVELDPDNNRELTLTLSDALKGIDKDDPFYEKKKQDWKSLESLAKTIKDDQLINPIFVYRFGNKCRLIAGERRTLASAIAGKNEIIARIASQRPVGTKLRILQWIENNERSDLSLAERVASIESIVKEYHAENGIGHEKITAKLLGNLTGMSITQARRYILILESNPEIKKAIQDGRLENIKLIELICSIKSPDTQREILKAAISGLSFEAISKLKKEIEIDNNNKKETRGRKKTNVNLGRVKPNVVKLIIDALVSSNLLEEVTLKQINTIYEKLQWNNNDSAEKGFKKIIVLLEKGA